MQNHSKIIVANWKMNLDSKKIKDYILKLSPLLQDAYESAIQKPMCQGFANIIFAPPFPYLNITRNLFLQYPLPEILFFAAQSCSPYKNGPHTGDVSAHMLEDLHIQYVLLGHSERRKNNFESNFIVQQQFLRAVECGIIPILCVGETEEEHLHRFTHTILQEQIFQAFPADLSLLPPHLIIAYEPVWAIGSHVTPDPLQIQETLNYIHADLFSFFTKQHHDIKVSLLYGGSVTAENAHSILSLPNIQGLLVGGASLNVHCFLDIINVANHLAS